VRRLSLPVGRAVTEVVPRRLDRPGDEPQAEPVQPWQVVVWNDPVNLMSYVVWVFRRLFGHTVEEATRLMLRVHQEGRAVVSAGPLEKAELDCYRLHQHGLWATLEQA
jgi:ATP-dependent Clp protease adaptor protein ClpS